MPTKTSKTKKPSKAQQIEVISCTLKLFENENQWTYGKWARDAKGFSVDRPKAKSACSWCLEGGLMKCSPDFPKTGDNEATSPIYDAVVSTLLPIAKRSRHVHSLYELNDLGRLPAVRALLKAGLKKLRQPKKAAA